MSTRGTYGFRVGNIDKLSYLAHNAFPGGFGVEFCEFLKHYSQEELLKLARALSAVRDSDGAPSASDVTKYKEFLGLHSNFIPVRWSELLARARGNLNALHRGLALYLPSEFIYDSLFCEWGYIADLDTGILEIYRGAQTELGQGRYNQEFCPNPGARYTGCKLIAELPLATLAKMSVAEYSVFMTLVHRWANDQELLDAGDTLPFPVSAALDLLRAKHQPGFKLGEAVEAIRVSDSASSSTVRALSKSETNAVVKAVRGPSYADDAQHSFNPELHQLVEQGRNLGFVTLVSDEVANNATVRPQEALASLEALRAQLAKLSEHLQRASGKLTDENWRELNDFAQIQTNRVKAFEAYISAALNKA